MPDPLLFETTFTASELRNSRPLDPDRRLRGPEGEALLGEIADLLATREARVRARKAADQARHLATISSLLANLAACSLNRVDPRRFLTVSFSRNEYGGAGEYAESQLSLVSMCALRDALLEAGLVSGRSGVRALDGWDGEIKWRTRLRATSRLIEKFADHDISFRAIERTLEIGPAKLRARQPGVSATPPASVETSLEVVRVLNSRLAKAQIALPEFALLRIAERSQQGTATEAKERANVGDLSANSVFRSFKYDWERGGRLYGGWWIGIPSDLRHALEIDGEPTVELDYSALHPSILLARQGLALTTDFYSPLGVEGPVLREAAKNIFMRSLNPAPGRTFTPKLTIAQRNTLPSGITEATFLAALGRNFDPIRHEFAPDRALRLQKEDSDLAIEVLRRLGESQIVALPVHDSFIVQKRHEQSLREAMVGAYKERYNQVPIIK